MRVRCILSGIVLLTFLLTAGLVLVAGCASAPSRGGIPPVNVVVSTIALTTPVAIAEPGGVKLVENMVLAADAYPAVGAIPVVYKQPSGEAGVFHVGAIRVGTYTIADANGDVIESLPVEWSIDQSRLQALRGAADMIAVRVTLSGN